MLIPTLQGAACVCQELADIFNIVRPNKNGICIARLYGMSGQGKTTVGKTFCNHSLSKFYGKVCYLEFCRGKRMQKQKIALQYLPYCNKSHLKSLTIEEARNFVYFLSCLEVVLPFVIEFS
ncbi:hypothetical protein SUGI_0064480 [Cryptomeria japonica]|nr:hypothetical protein SUGI_0064480 [Cryptomeria japonica]